ncbi:uncharacterized protein EMH_0001230 [Eimeria mitis]|uniref:Uncharacterized protein n=1 Tax=Eimeria mitis TaxID=44415 RepID=U6JSM6_9EIME|nr:uncharacterized protein EMH_0001230 [Eimeria mitis]CDJ28409.1 hypothetical protein, conserved [Eimeria mitis]
MDAILMSHKGPVDCDKPLFSVKRAEVAPSRLASEGMIFCARKGDFVSTAEKLHPAFAAFDAEEKREATSAQRSRAICWGVDEDSESDSDCEEDLDEEAEDLLKFLSELPTSRRA